MTIEGDVGFGKALLQSAKALDIPAAGAKARVLAHVANVTGAVGTAAAGSTVTTLLTSGAPPAKLGWLVWALGSGAAVLAGAGGFAVGQVTARETHAAPSTSVAVASTSGASDKDTVDRASPTSPRSVPGAVVSTRKDADAGTEPSNNMCIPHALPDVAPAVCSKKLGKAVPFSLNNACGEDVDIFWVDFECREVFHKRLAAGESYEQTSEDGHVWRIRDHRTRALVKEFIPQRVPGAPELVRPKSRRVLPEVVLGDNHGDGATSVASTSSDESPPAECSGDGVPTKFFLKNERSEQIVVMWLDHHCKEKYWGRVEPKGSLWVNGVDADAWRIRDAKTGRVVQDLVPEVPDTTTYLTVP